MFAAAVLRNAAASASSASGSAAVKQQAAGFSQAHKAYVKSLYRRYLKNSLDWVVRRDIWRDRAIEIRVEFERHREVRNPRELANLFQRAEKELETIKHPDPYKREYCLSKSSIAGVTLLLSCSTKSLTLYSHLTAPMFEDGTKWERNIPPPVFSEAEKKAAIEAMNH